MAECLVIPRNVLIDSGFIPENSSGKAHYQRICSFGELYRMLHVARDNGDYMERKGAEGAELNPAFQQLTMYGYIVRDDGSFFLYERGGTEHYDEERLAGKVSVGVGSHMERTDLNLARSFYRELIEELDIVVNGEVINFYTEDGEPDINKMKKYLKLIPTGLIKDERDEVGKVHLGVACKVSIKDTVSKSDRVEIRIKENGENVRSSYVINDEYEAMVTSGSVTPEGWTNIVYDNELKQTAVID